MLAHHEIISLLQSTGYLIMLSTVHNLQNYIRRAINTLNRITQLTLQIRIIHSQINFIMDLSSCKVYETHGRKNITRIIIPYMHIYTMHLFIYYF